jgi:hypothetical protein
MENRVVRYEYIMRIPASMPDMMSDTEMYRFPGYFVSLCNTTLHRITLLIGLVVILPVLADF